MGPPIDAADSVLLVGPTLSGRRRLFHHVVADFPAAPVLVSTRQPAERIRESHERFADTPRKRLVAGSDGSADTASVETACRPSEPVVVDCVTSALGESPTDTHATKYAQHPSNLTSIGTKFTEVVEELDDTQCTVGVETISPLLAYADTTQVFQFVHLICQQAHGAGWSVVAMIDAAAHAEVDIERFVPLFDCVLETRRTSDDEQVFRVRQSDQFEWRPVSSRR